MHDPAKQGACSAQGAVARHVILVRVHAMTILLVAPTNCFALRQLASKLQV